MEMLENLSLTTYILMGWGTFVVLSYLIMWYDSKEHHFNIGETIQEIVDSFKQDE